MAFPKSIWRWAFYDFANSAYLLVFTTFLLPVYFATRIDSGSFALGGWGVANGVATVIGVILAILVGKYSDRHSKFQAFQWSIYLSFIGMFLLGLAVQYALHLVEWIFIFTQGIFILALSLSDSILPHLASKEDSFNYSGFAWGFGYLGGIAALIISLILQQITGDDYHPLIFMATALFYLIFSIYSLRGLKQVKMHVEPQEESINDLPHISKKNKFLLLFGYWLISEGITVIFLFISIFLSQEMHFSNTLIAVLLLLIQLIAFPATWYGGKLSQKYDTLKLLGISILLWGVAIVVLFLNLGWLGLAILVVSGALAVGNSQSFLRAHYANIIPKSKSGYEFGIYTIVSEASVFIGPIIYGLASDYLHSQKLPLFGLLATMLIGFVLIWRTLRRIHRKIAL